MTFLPSSDYVPQQHRSVHETAAVRLQSWYSSHVNKHGAQPEIVKVGPKGYIHGWICVRPPCGKAGDEVSHPDHGSGKITDVDNDGRLHAKFGANTSGVLGAAKTMDLSEKKRLVKIWANSYRYADKSLYRGNWTPEDTQRGLDFVHEMHRLLSDDTPSKSSSPGSHDAHVFLGMVNQDAIKQDKELLRGIILDKSAASEMFSPGKAIDMPLVSWTSESQIATDFATGKRALRDSKNNEPGKIRVILHVAPGAKALDITKLAPNYPISTENEAVTGGRYTVDSAKFKGKTMNVYLTQQDFNAH